MLRFRLNSTASFTATPLLAEGYKALIAKSVPVGGLVQLASK